MNGPGQGAHQSNPAAAIDQGVALAGQPRAHFLSRFEKYGSYRIT
jgi:hypothetical protein